MIKKLCLTAASLSLFCLSLMTLHAAESESHSAKIESLQVVVEIEVNRPDESRRYRKPYVAVWVEDKDGYPVRTIALWLMTDRPGPRWHPDLRQWYKNDRMRLLVEGSDLIGGVDGVSGATRSPGKYKVAWDGTDNAGAPLPQGEYTLLVEAAREHGTYQLIKQPITLDGRNFKMALKGNVEIKGVNIECRNK